MVKKLNMAGKSDFDLKLINEVHKRPILWDSRSEDYKFAERKPEEWSQIAALLESDISNFCCRLVTHLPV